MKQLDFIDAIERAYDRSSTDEMVWLEGIVKAVHPAFNVGMAPTSSWFFDVEDPERHLNQVVSVGEVPYTREQYDRMRKAANAGPERIVYECDPFTRLSRVVGREVVERTVRAAEMNGGDSLGLRANLTPTNGVIFTTLVPWSYRIRQRDLWMRFAAHVGAALRMRRLQGAPSPDSAVAVLTPRGKLEHATNETAQAREELAGAAKDMDRARGKMRRLDPDAASQLWRTMVRGEWSLVDWFDHDGKRFLLAQENRVPVATTATTKSLSERERQVVACAAMGHSNKLIAYDLGLSTGTVSVLLARAAKKLGVTDRVALIRVFRESLAKEEAAPASAG